MRILELVDCAIGSGGVAALLGATAFSELVAFSLVQCGLTGADVEALARSRSFPKLSYLDLSWNEAVTVRSARAVLAAKHFPQLSGVNLYASAIAEPEQIPLALDAPDRPKLTVEFSTVNVQRTIDGAEVIVETGGVANHRNDLFDNFAACAGAKRVTQLVAPRIVGRASLTALADGLNPDRLWRLDLSNTPLGNAGVSEVVTAFARFWLRELRLRECRVGAAGVRAIVNSPLFATVRTLDLSDNNIGEAGAAALVKAGMPHALEELRLDASGFGYSEKKQLKAQFGAKLKM